MEPLEALMKTWAEDHPAEPVVSASKYTEESKQKFKLGWKLAARNLKKARWRQSLSVTRKPRTVHSSVETKSCFCYLVATTG